MKSTTHPGGPAGPNQGEGDRRSARHYNRNLREFIAQGKVDDAARQAASYVEAEPEDARRAEAAARKGPRRHPRVSVEELVAKGRTLADRARPVVRRVIARVRAQIGRGGSTSTSRSSTR